MTDGTDGHKPARKRHLATKRYRRFVTGLQRVGNCLRNPIWKDPAGGGPARSSVTLSYSPRTGARFTGLQRCGSVWACPECAAIIAQGRIEQLRAMMLEAERRKMGAAWQTLTLPHDAPDRLRDRTDTDGVVVPGTLGLITEGWRRIRQGTGWRRLAARLEVIGTIRKVEVTHGSNGWHPHLHLTYLTARPLSEGELEELEAYVFAAWSTLVTAAGYRAPRLELCPIALLRLDSTAWAEYLGKMLGLELAGQEKRTRTLAGRMPFEILTAACEVARDNRHLRGKRLAEQPDVRLWREYESATRGRRQLVWSHGLKRELGIAELTEEQELELGDCLIEQETVTLYSFAPMEWRALWLQPGRLEAVIEIAEQPAPEAERTAMIRDYLTAWVNGMMAAP